MKSLLLLFLCATTSLGDPTEDFDAENLQVDESCQCNEAVQLLKLDLEKKREEMEKQAADFFQMTEDTLRMLNTSHRVIEAQEKTINELRKLVTEDSKLTDSYLGLKEVYLLKENCDSSTTTTTSRPPGSSSPGSVKVLVRKEVGNHPHFFDKTFSYYQEGFSANGLLKEQFFPILIKPFLGESWLGLDKLHNLIHTRRILVKLLISSQSLNGHNSASRRAREVPKKKENHQNLTPKNMSKSNPVHL